MHDMMASAVLAQELAHSSAQLTALAERITGEAASGSRVDLSGWSGPASWGAHLAIAFLERELDVAIALIHSAANLTHAASEEVRSRG